MLSVGLPTYNTSDRSQPSSSIHDAHDHSFDPYDGDFECFCEDYGDRKSASFSDEYYKAGHSEARDHVFMNIESTFEQDLVST